MKDVLSVVQIVIATLLVAVIILQSRGAGFGGAFGAQAAVYRTRRGLEQHLFRATILLSVVFVITALVVARLYK
ncbi:MAG: preprotein translocase subunit SecG, preprotein translocase subunit SecG [Dehalococcoidia bacterium]|nr:preprotein translocase subunit SecG, preprotein translocase subunit SecG [Dehalococcoidia bacterium]